MRLPVLGPVANADLVGLDLTLAIHQVVLPYLNVSTQPSSTLSAHVQANELGFKSKSGFLPWTEESMAGTRNTLTTHLLELLSRKKNGTTQCRK
jgi:3-hydroxybutyryl-CoA dehydrogenase